jgi:hypothetical protein
MQPYLQRFLHHAAGPAGLRDTLSALCVRRTAASKTFFHFRAERF